MKPRLIKLLEILQRHPIVNSTYLSQKIGVSNKTIQKDIKELNEYISPYGGQVKSKRGVGYKLTISNQEFFDQFFQQIGESKIDQIPATNEERVQYILERLLTSTKEYLTLDQLAEELYISRSAIHLLMKEVTEILDTYRLTLKRRPYYGLRIEGDEFFIRSCMSQYLLPRDNPNPLIEIKEELNQGYLDHDLPVIRKIILQCIEKTNIYLSDMELDNLVIHIAIAIKRIKEFFPVNSLGVDLKEFKNTLEYEIAQNIITRLEEHYEIYFPKEEVIYICIHLLGTNVNNSCPDKGIEEILGTKVHNLMIDLLRDINDKFGFDFRHDRELFIGLGLHLKTLLNRLKYNLNLRNPLISDIKNNLPYPFEISLTLCENLTRMIGYGINENETGYIALHIAAALKRISDHKEHLRCLIVCGTGLGSARLLSYKIKETFGEKLKIVEITGYYQLDVQQILKKKIDLIISTVNLPFSLPVPVVRVNTIFGKDDMKAIENILYSNKDEVIKYIRDDLVILQLEAWTKEEVIRHLCDRIVSLKIAPGGLYRSVIEREELSSTAYGSLIAIPHPLQPLSNETVLAFATLKKSISWEEQQVQFVCLFSVKRKNDEDLQKLYDFLYHIINNDKTVNQLICAKEIEEFKRILMQNDF